MEYASLVLMCFGGFNPASLTRINWQHTSRLGMILIVYASRDQASGRHGNA